MGGAEPDGPNRDAEPRRVAARLRLLEEEAWHLERRLAAAEDRLAAIRAQRNRERAAEERWRDRALIRLADRLSGLIARWRRRRRGGTKPTAATPAPSTPSPPGAGPRAAIRIATKSAAVAEDWGDTHFAHDLAAALTAEGWPTRVVFRDEWTDPTLADCDLVIDVLGLAAPAAPVGRHPVLWLISHPERADPAVLARYERVYVASRAVAARLAAELAVPVVALMQATDPERFRPSETAPTDELLVVANWRSDRRILADLLPTRHRLAVIGRNWTPERLEPRYLVAEHVPNGELPARYAAAAIVLNDHWPAMRREGFLSNRIYDAAVAGALVIRDDAAGLEEEFDGGVPAYWDRDHLAELVDRYLDDPELRRATADRARAAILERHTFRHRARTILSAIAGPDGPPGKPRSGGTLPRDVRHE